MLFGWVFFFEFIFVFYYGFRHCTRGTLVQVIMVGVPSGLAIFTSLANFETTIVAQENANTTPSCLKGGWIMIFIILHEFY